MSTTAGSALTVSDAMASTSLYNGPLVLTGGTLNAGQRKTVYVNGDVFIDTNILYNAAAMSSTNIPAFRLYAKGNIYVAAGVSELNGTYAAQLGAANTGKLYTCGFRTGTSFRIPTDAEMIDSTNGCGRKLTVYGALLAQTLKLLRTNGTLRSATSGEASSSANQAETIIFTPQVWLTGPRDDGGYNAITGLPPVL
jgi:hypothetical protein